jgi:hypothetical protein
MTTGCAAGGCPEPARTRSGVRWRSGAARGLSACHCVRVLLRLLREPRTGRPAPLARLVALLVVVGLLVTAGPVLLPMVRWVASFL